MIQYIHSHQEDQDELINIILGNTINSPQPQINNYPIHLFQTHQLDHEKNLSHAQTQLSIDLINEPEQAFSSLLNSQSQHPLSYSEQSQSAPQNLLSQKVVPLFRPTKHKKQKNSNTIKKIGRIILDNLRQYKNFEKPNPPVANMLKILSKNSKVGRTEINKRDKFNTYHLRLLVNGRDEQVVSHNLRTTRRILNKCLRDNVLSSKQITNQNKLLYLNTMKCSALRCINKNLAVRLQMSM